MVVRPDLDRDPERGTEAAVAGRGGPLSPPCATVAPLLIGGFARSEPKSCRWSRLVGYKSECRKMVVEVL